MSRPLYTTLGLRALRWITDLVALRVHLVMKLSGALSSVPCLLNHGTTTWCWSHSTCNGIRKMGSSHFTKTPSSPTASCPTEKRPSMHMCMATAPVEAHISPIFPDQITPATVSSSTVTQIWKAQCLSRLQAMLFFGRTSRPRSSKI